MTERASLVLLVDGDDAPRRGARWCLSRAGFQVLAVGSSEEAFEVIDLGRSVDVIVADIAVPGIQAEVFPAGLALNPRMGIVAITEDVRRRRLKRMTRRTPLFYVEKPIDFDLLLQSVQLAVTASNPGPARRSPQRSTAVAKASRRSRR